MNRNIVVYENDLKFDNSLKSNKDIIYDKPHLKDIGETNTFEYRLKLMDSNNNFLDLTSMNISNLSFFIKYQNIYDKIYYLFLNNNKLNNTIDLSYLTNLISVDVANNNITNIKVPDNLKELVINNNLLEELPVNINLIRLECSHNKIKYIPSCYTKLELLTASNNSIEFIPTFINLRKMVINDNPLKEIKILPSVIYLDISYSCLEYLEEHPKLDHLVANSTKLIELPNIRTLTTIELIETPIKRIQYFPNIDTIICSINLTNHISNKYKNDYDIKLKNNNIICITRILV